MLSLRPLLKKGKTVIVRESRVVVQLVLSLKKANKKLSKNLNKNLEIRNNQLPLHSLRKKSKGKINEFFKSFSSN